MSTATAVALQEADRADTVQEAFDQFLDHAVLCLALAGVESTPAIEVIFTIADLLAEDETLPPFPDDTTTYIERGEWLVAAAELDFISFVVEAVEG